VESKSEIMESEIMMHGILDLTTHMEERVDAWLDLLKLRKKEIALKDIKIAALDDTNRVMHENINRAQQIIIKLEFEMDGLREALEVKTLQLERCMR